MMINDKIRYPNGKMPIFQKYYRKYNLTHNVVLKPLYKVLFVFFRNRRFIEMSVDTKIGDGLYFGHAYAIMINPKTIIGKNCNIHKGVTLGQENRGGRKGTPIIGNEVWIGINSTIVGHVHIGDDVMIAPNTFINCDVPSHSIVFGNPCVIKRKENATLGYINSKYHTRL